MDPQSLLQNLGSRRVLLLRTDVLVTYSWSCALDSSLAATGFGWPSLLRVDWPSKLHRRSTWGAAFRACEGRGKRGIACISGVERTGHSQKSMHPFHSRSLTAASRM